MSEPSSAYGAPYYSAESKLHLTNSSCKSQARIFTSQTAKQNTAAISPLQNASSIAGFNPGKAEYTRHFPCPQRSFQQSDLIRALLEIYPSCQAMWRFAHHPMQKDRKWECLTSEGSGCLGSLKNIRGLFDYLAAARDSADRQIFSACDAC